MRRAAMSAESNHLQASEHDGVSAARGGWRGAARAQSALFASMLSTMVTMSSTIMPPLSSVLFQLMPKSLRFTTVVAEKPAFEPHDWPPTLTADEPRNSASNTTGLVT